MSGTSTPKLTVSTIKVLIDQLSFDDAQQLKKELCNDMLDELIKDLKIICCGDSSRVENYLHEARIVRNEYEFHLQRVQLKAWRERFAEDIIDDGEDSPFAHLVDKWDTITNDQWVEISKYYGTSYDVFEYQNDPYAPTIIPIG